MKRFLAFLLLTSAFIACDHDDSIHPVSMQPSITPPEAGHLIAQRLSILVQQEYVRTFLKDRLMKRFDGDNNFLLAMHSADPAGNGLTFAQLLEQDHRIESMDQLLRTDPQLQVAMPDLGLTHARDWDVSAHIPVVVYRSPDLDHQVQSTVTGYHLGVPVSISLKTMPAELLLVVSNNERTQLVPRREDAQRFLRASGYSGSCSGEAAPVFESDEYKYYLKAELQNCTSSTYGTAGTSASDCEREMANLRDHVTRVRFTTMNYMRAAESYLDGNPEVYFIVTLASKNPSGFSSLRKSFPSSDRSDWKDCGVFSCTPEWNEFDQPVFNWDNNVFGDLVRYDWFEEDFSSGKVDLTLGLTSKFESTSVSGNVKVTINKKDYFLDQDFVNYCDPVNGRGTEYNTGKLLFAINHQ